MENNKRIVVKVGSNVISESGGGPDRNRIKHLVNQIHKLKSNGYSVILISSGAVASGRGVIELSEKIDPISRRQILSSIGQVKLINIYDQFFQELNENCAQILVTQSDFRDRNHYLNMQNCVNSLLQHDVIPIINENDTVSITELMFTDNDALAGMVSSLVAADQLIILSNVDGIYTGNPSNDDSKLIEEVNALEEFEQYISSNKSSFGRGGMLTKANMALKMADLGVEVHIANGTRSNVLLDLINQKAPSTKFPAKKKKDSTRQWIASSEKFAKGIIKINKGAVQALLENDAASLLPVGVTEVHGDFQEKDIVQVENETGQIIGYGRVAYSSSEAQSVVGKQGEKPRVHYNCLYIKD